MTSIEDRVRAAATAAAAQVADVRPLDLPGAPPSRHPVPRLRRGWVVPLTAAAAIVAIAALLVVAHLGQNDSGPQQPSAKVTPACGGPAVATAPANLPSDVPQYFVELCGPGRYSLGVADTRTGALLGSIPPPSGAYSFARVYGAADDRTFVVEGDDFTDGHPGFAFWRLRLAPGTAHPLTFTKLPWELRIPALPIALSPDGTKVALFTDGAAGIAKPAPLVQVYSVADGTLLRTWTTTDVLVSLKWTGDGKGLAYELHSGLFAVRDIATPGSALSTGSTPLLPAFSLFMETACRLGSNWAVSADGTTMTCPSIGTSNLITQGTSCSSHARVELGFYHSVATSRLSGPAPVGTDYSVAAPNPCGNPEVVSLWWASPDGTEVIGALQYPGHSEVGVFADGRYVPLPALGNGPPSPSLIAF